MILRGLCIDYSKENITLNTFQDTDVDAWQAQVVNKAEKLGWISKHTKFRPNDTITRVEALKMVMQAAGVPLINSKASSFRDVPVDGWMVRYTETGLFYGIVSGQLINGDRMFRPNDTIKRGESTKMIIKSIFPTPTV